jgi:outer membrane protein assembly factor BamD (BamD/ComL family)
VKCFWIALVFLVSCIQPLQAAYLFKNGHFINAKDVATMAIEEHYQAGLDALKASKWEDAAAQFRIITVSFPEASLATEALYYFGVALYELSELDLANNEFGNYLKKNNSSEHLEDVYRYKLSIADKFAQGHRRHMFNSSSFPRIMSADDLALDIYNEVSIALPNHALAAQALLGKSALLFHEEDFSLAADTYQSTIRRFPGTSFALKAYEGISNCYMQEIQRQMQNLDVITMAEINCAQLKRDFPQAKENETIQSKLTEMKNVYAIALFETGQFYERKKQPKASALYYHLALTSFPESKVAPQSKERLKELSKYVEELHLYSTT